MSKHTPGPWRTDGTLPDAAASIEIRGPGRGPDRVWIGVAHGCHDPKHSCGCKEHIPGFPTDEEAVANARLIAAAPDLLGALGEILDCLESDEKDLDTFVSIGDIAAQAINNAMKLTP